MHKLWLWLLGLLGGLRVTTGPLEVSRFSQGPAALREWELVRIGLTPLDYVACLPLLCQGSKWLNGESIWLVFRRSWVRIPAGSQFFSVDYFSLSHQKHSCSSLALSVYSCTHSCTNTCTPTHTSPLYRLLWRTVPFTLWLWQGQEKKPTVREVTYEVLVCSWSRLHNLMHTCWYYIPVVHVCCTVYQ